MQQPNPEPPIQPYVGPRSFQKDQRQVFFGRDEEADELVSIITAHAAVLFYSQSGAGKTSLLNAKLIPRLEEAEHFNVLPPMRVQGQIPSTLKIGKSTNIFVFNALLSCNTLGSNKGKPGMTFSQYLDGCDKFTNDYGEPSPTVMIFDQFEELFTSYPGRWADREEFFRQVGEALEGNPKKGIPPNPLLRVIFCMREDYIAELDPYLPLLPEKLRTRFRLEHLREKKALTAITEPLKKTNRTYAPRVAEQLVKNLLRIPNQSMTGTQTMGLYVEPVQLQVVCQSLWDALTPQENVITANHLKMYGNVSEALSRFYERSIASVSKETEVKEETLRRWFGDTLITPEGTRAPVNRGNDTTGGMPNAAVDKLEAIRLIKGEWKGTNVRWYELAHDRFIEPIRRSNEKWLVNQSRSEQIRLRLEAKASKWQPGSKLLDAEELIEARRIVQAKNASPSLRALVDASRVGAQKKRIRLLRLAVIGCIVVALVFLTLAVFAFQKRKEANAAEGRARSSYVALKAREFLDENPELSVLLAKEAIDHIADTKEAKDVVRAGLMSLSNVDAVLPDPGSKVISAEFNKDGNLVLTRTIDNSVKLWDAHTRRMIKELNDGEGALSAVFNADGNRVATGGEDGVARIWNAADGTLVKELKGHTGPVNRAVFNPKNDDYVATAGADSTVRIWNLSNEEQKVLHDHTAGVSELVFDSDGKQFATEAADEKAIVWRADGKKIATLTDLTGSHAALAFSPDGKLIATEAGPGTELGASGTGDYPVTVWNVATSKVQLTLHGHQDAIATVSFSDKGAILTSSKDRTTRLWGNDGRLVREIRGRGRAQADTRRLTAAGAPEKEMFGIARFSPNGDFVVTANLDTTVRVWDALDGKLIDELRGHTEEVNSVAFNSDNNSIITASDDQTVRFWPFHREADKKNARVETWDHSGLIASLTALFSPQRGPDVAVITRDGELWLEGVGPQRSVPLKSLGDKYTTVGEVRFSPDQQSIAITSSGIVLLYKLESLRESIDSNTSTSIYRESIPPQGEIATPAAIEFAGHSAKVKSFAFNKDGSLMVTASNDGTARVWNTTTGQTVGKLEGHTDIVNSATFSNDGRFIVTASDDGTVRIWDAVSFALVRKIDDSFTTRVYYAEYNSSGDLIVVASRNAASIYDAQTGQLKRRLEEDTEVITASFSPDSHLVITATSGKLAHVWNAQTGESVATLADHKGPVFEAFFSSDGQRVFTASEYEVRSYPREAFAPFEEIRSLIDQRVRRALSDQERKAYLRKPE